MLEDTTGGTSTARVACIVPVLCVCVVWSLACIGAVVVACMNKSAVTLPDIPQMAVLFALGSASAKVAQRVFGEKPLPTIVETPKT